MSYSIHIASPGFVLPRYNLSKTFSSEPLDNTEQLPVDVL